MPPAGSKRVIGHFFITLLVHIARERVIVHLVRGLLKVLPLLEQESLKSRIMAALHEHALTKCC
jgi:hypothetical protein